MTFTGMKNMCPIVSVWASKECTIHRIRTEMTLPLQLISCTTMEFYCRLLLLLYSFDGFLEYFFFSKNNSKCNNYNNINYKTTKIQNA